MKKLLKLVLISIFTLFPLFADEAILEDNTVVTEEVTDIVLQKEEEIISDTTEKKKKSFLDKVEIVTQIDTNFYLSPESAKNHSNPLEILYPISVGILWPRNYFIGFQPTISLVPMNFLWFEDMALPSEIENRTATTLMTFINLPAVFTFKLPHSKLHLSAGVGINLRYSFLSLGVDKTDPGFNGNTAQEDVKLINKWFWENAHWLYLTAGTSWLYPITDKIQVGPVFDVKIPMGLLIDEKNVQGMMLSVGFKLCI